MTEAHNTATTENLPAMLPPAQRAALALRSSQTEADLKALAAASADITAVIDMDGREQAHRIAMTLRTARTTIEKTGKAARDDATKFSKAVIAEEDRLISLIAPEEKRVLALRDDYDAEQERIQAEKIAAERRRTEAHEANIAAMKATPTKCIGMSAREVMAVIDMAAMKWDAHAGTWEEFEEQAATAYEETIAALRELYRVKLESEEAAAAEAAAREAERQRIAAEQAELARQRAEQEQAARELAEQQAALRRQQEEAARAAAAEKAKAEAAAAAQAAEMKRQMDELAAARAAFEAEQNRAAAARRAAEELERDHAEALEMNAAWQPPELRPIATQEEAEAIYENAIANEEAPPLLPYEEMLPLDIEPTDDEILAVYLEEFGGTATQARARLARFAG